MSEQMLPVAEGLAPEITAAGIAKPRRFVKRVAWTFAARLSMVFSGIATSIIAAHWLGAKGLGQLAVVNTTGALALQIGSAGLPSAMVYFVAKNRRHFAPMATNAMLFAVVVGGALAVVIIAVARLDPAVFGFVPPRLMAVGAVSIPFLLITLLGLNLLLAIDRVAHFNLIDAAAPLFVLLNSLVALVLMQAGIFSLVSMNTVAAVLIALVTVFVVIHQRRSASASAAWRPDLSLLRSMTTYSVKFYISIIAGVIIIRADLLIVNHFRGAGEAGVYAVASQVATLLMLLPGVIATLLFPQIASSDDKDAIFAMRVTRHASFIMIASCAAAVGVAFLLPFVYGAQFADATLQLLILLPGVYLISIEAVLVQHFTGTGLPAAIPWFWVITVAVSVGLNLLLVPTFGARAAALVSTISYAVIFVLVAWYFRARTGNSLRQVLVIRRTELSELFGKLSEAMRRPAGAHANIQR